MNAYRSRWTARLFHPGWGSCAQILRMHRTRALSLGRMGAWARSAKPCVCVNVIVLSLIVLSLGACNRGKSSADPSSNASATDTGTTANSTQTAALPKEEQPQNLVKVRVLTLNPRDIHKDQTYIGALNPLRRVKLAAEVSGVVEWADFEENDNVRKKQQLARIDTSRLSHRRDLAQSNLRLAQDTQARNQQLFEKKLLSTSQLELSQNRLEINRINLSMAELELKKSIAHAPIHGLIKKKHIEQGEYVNPGQPIAEILYIQTLLARFPVPENEMRYFQLGMPVQLEFDALPALSLTEKVKHLGAEADQASRSFLVAVEVQNQKRQLRAGMLVRVRVRLSTHRQQIIVPQHAVLQRSDKQVVFVLKNGRGVEQTVETGVNVKGGIQITKGLESGEQLIVRGHRLLISGDPVIVESPPIQKNPEQTAPQNSSS